MFRRVHRVKSILQVLRERAPHYGPLARDDLRKFRDVIVSGWDGPHRIAVAWTVCCGWGVLALSGLWYARKAISGPPPFQLTAAALARDYTSLFALADRP